MIENIIENPQVIIEVFRAQNTRVYYGDPIYREYIKSLQLPENSCIEVNFIKNNEWHKINIIWKEVNYAITVH